MARLAAPSVKFYTRHKKTPANFWKPLAYQIVVSYDRKRLTIPQGYYSAHVSGDEFDTFAQLKSDGTPQDPNTTSEEVLELSKRLQDTRRYYETALSMLIEKDLWKSIDLAGFRSFLFLYEMEIRLRMEQREATPHEVKFNRAFKRAHGIENPLRFKGVKL